MNDCLLLLLLLQLLYSLNGADGATKPLLETHFSSCTLSLFLNLPFFSLHQDLFTLLLFFLSFYFPSLIPVGRSRLLLLLLFPVHTYSTFSRRAPPPSFLICPSFLLSPLLILFPPPPFSLSSPHSLPLPYPTLPDPPPPPPPPPPAPPCPSSPLLPSSLEWRGFAGLCAPSSLHFKQR